MFGVYRAFDLKKARAGFQYQQDVAYSVGLVGCKTWEPKRIQE